MSTENKLANAGPLGLTSLGITTILLSLHNAGYFPQTAIILAMAVFFGGMAQIIAGLLEFRRGDTFGTLAFISYGCLWLSLVATWVLPAQVVAAPNEAFMGWYFTLWGVFTLFMFLGTFRGSRVLQALFLFLTVLFALLAFREFLQDESIGIVAGYVGIACGGLALYLAMAEVLHEQYGRSILPF